jgi:hypothetical protein
MRRLLRSALALLTLGMVPFGCNKSGTPGDGSNGAAEAPFKVTFRVPGMS